MWFFVDESWSPDGFSPKFGVLLGVLVKDEQLNRMDKLLFDTIRKYYGSKAAKDAHTELKGKDLLSNYVLNLTNTLLKSGALPKNICIVKEILSYPIKAKDFYLKVFASTVYSMDNKHPALLSSKPRELYEPFRKLIFNVSQAASEDAPGNKVTLVFDQRIGAQKDIAIAIHNYIAGTRLKNIEKYPYFAVSNVSPGVKYADIMAYLLSKRYQGTHIKQHRLIMQLYNEMKNLCWVSKRTPIKYGLVKLNEIKSDSDIRYVVRK